MKRAVLGVAVAVGLVVGIALPTFALGLTQVTLSCDDGTSVTLVVNTDTLTSLTDSVQGMIAYPAGLTCTLVQSPVLLSLGVVAFASSGSNPFIVAGGRWQVPCSALTLSTPTGLAEGGIVARVPGAWYSLGDIGAASPPTSQTESVWVNIAVNVHQKDDSTTFFGTLNETIPANQTCPTDTVGGTMTFGESHFTSTPTCLMISAGTLSSTPVAYVTSKVTQTSGLPFPAGSDATVAAGSYVHFGFQDNGNPPGQNPTDSTPSTDMLNGPPASAAGSPTQSCTTENNPEVLYHLGAFDGTKQYGNITLHLGP